MNNISERTKATKAVILSRVSSKGQEDNYSKGAQIHRLQEYCTKKGLEIIKVFDFTESSTKGERKKFMEAINFAKSQKEIIAVVTDKVDRLQRSHREFCMLDDLISREKIELHFYTENCIIHKYSTSQEKMMWNVHVMMAQSYVDSLRDNVNRSIAQKLRCGEWISTAPVGYLHVPNPNKDKGGGTIEVDPDRAPLVKKLFEEYATGKYSMAEMLRKTKQWGLRNSRGNKSYLTKSHIYEIIQNPFYYGVMRLKKNGQQYPHIYPPIIGKELFDACQDIYCGRKNKSFKYAGKEFIFRGLIKCAITNRIITADVKTRISADGITPLKWTYLIAANPDNPEKKIYVKEEVILEEVENTLKSLIMPKPLVQDIIEYLRKTVHMEQDISKKRINELNVLNTKITNRMSRLMDLYMDGDIGKEEHEAKREELTKQRQETIKEIELHHQADDKFTERLVTLVEFASNAYDTYKSSIAEGKRQIINLVYSNLKLRGEKPEFMLRPPFNEFVKLPKIGEWWVRQDLNLRQHRYERCVLTN